MFSFIEILQKDCNKWFFQFFHSGRLGRFRAAVSGFYIPAVSHGTDKKPSLKRLNGFGKLVRLSIVMLEISVTCILWRFISTKWLEGFNFSKSCTTSSQLTISQNFAAKIAEKFRVKIDENSENF